MKKIILVLTALLLLVMSATGCRQQEAPPAIRSAVDSKCRVECPAGEFVCHLRYIDPSTATLTILRPAALANLRFGRSENGSSVSLRQLICKNLSLPDVQKGLPQTVFHTFDRIVRDNPHYVGRTDDNRYEFSADDLTLFTDADGNPLFISSGSTQITLLPAE